MFSTNWQVSQRQHEVLIERDRKIPVEDGIKIDCDIFRPVADGKFPVLLAVHPYDKGWQSASTMPVAFSGQGSSYETGDYNFYVRRGYVLVIANLRGTHASEGFFSHLDPDPRSVRDIYETIEWLADQPWSDGNVGMLGVSYLAVVQKRVAALAPPHLKAIFAPYGWSDGYRDLYYRGGIAAHGFLTHWLNTYCVDYQVKNNLREAWGDEKYDAAIAEARQDPELMAIPAFKKALGAPDEGVNPLFCEILVNHLIGPYFAEREVDFEAASSVPIYAGGDWKGYAFHLAGDIRAFENWSGAKKLTIGPGIYLDRPLYQYAFESLRWFDHWLKGVDTGLMEEAPVQLFIEGTDEWKEADDWPVPGTKWTPFYLHANGLLSEHEHWPNEGFSTYEDSPFSRGGVTFRTPPMVENTEICGPMVLNLYGSTTDTEVLWFVTIWRYDTDDREHLLTRGWLRGSQRKLDEEKSKPWQPVHAHDERQPLTPDEIYEFNIEVRPYGILLKAGERIGIRIRGADDEVPEVFIETIAQGQIARPAASHVSLHHNADHPSHLLLPITRGNRIGTFISGGKLPPLARP